MRTEDSFTARAVSAFSPDRLYRVYVLDDQLAFVKIGGQKGVAAGLAAPFGLLGHLVLVHWNKRSARKLQERLAADAQQDVGVLLARDKRNFMIQPGQIVRASIEPPARIGAHGPHHGVWKFESTDGKTHTLQFEEVGEMHTAVRVLPRILGGALAVNAQWDEQRGRYVRAATVSQAA